MANYIPVGKPTILKELDDSKGNLTYKGNPIGGGSSDDAIKFPNNKGTNGQFLCTDGNNHVSWQTPQGGGGSTLDSDYIYIPIKNAYNYIKINGGKNVYTKQGSEYVEYQGEDIDYEETYYLKTLQFSSNNNPILSSGELKAVTDTFTTFGKTPTISDAGQSYYLMTSEEISNGNFSTGDLSTYIPIGKLTQYEMNSETIECDIDIVALSSNGYIVYVAIDISLQLEFQLGMYVTEQMAQTMQVPSGTYVTIFSESNEPTNYSFYTYDLVKYKIPEQYVSFDKNIPYTINIGSMRVDTDDSPNPSYTFAYYVTNSDFNTGKINELIDNNIPIFLNMEKDILYYGVSAADLSELAHYDLGTNENGIIQFSDCVVSTYARLSFSKILFYKSNYDDSIVEKYKSLGSYMTEEQFNVLSKQSALYKKVSETSYDAITTYEQGTEYFQPVLEETNTNPALQLFVSVRFIPVALSDIHPCKITFALQKIPVDSSGGIVDWSDVTNKPNFATVATSGSYTDLSNTPTIPAAQIQSNWTQSDSSKLDYIKNKPAIPAAQIQSDWSQSDNTKLDFIKNKPSIPAAQIQSDYNQSNSSALDYIKNKPDLSVYALSSSLGAVATSNSYNDLNNKPTIPDISGCEVTTNKVTSLSNASTDTQYPSAKCVYDGLETKQNTLTAGTGITIDSQNVISATGGGSGGGSSSRLPSAYQEVEWIQNDGSSYIQLDYVFKGTSQVRMTAEASDWYSSSGKGIFGVRTSNTSRLFELLSLTGKVRADYGNNGDSSNFYEFTLESGKHNIDFNSVSLSIDETLIHTFSTRNQDIGTYNACIFCANQGGKPNTPIANMKLYEWQVFTDGIPISHAIPCYRIADSIIGLYDVVRDVFYTNAGTGTFTKGPDVYESGGVIPLLPNEYQECEYIQSTGTQYIDTGYVPKLTTRWELKTMFQDGDSLGNCRNGRYGTGDGERFCISCWTVTTDPQIEMSIGSYKSARIKISYNFNGTATQYSINQKPYLYKLSVPSLSCDINPYYYDTFSAPTFSSTDTIYLNARNMGNGDYDGCGTQIFYSHKIWENGTRVQDFVPCYRKSDGEVGMFDLVSRQFFTNAGTGSFIKGPDCITCSTESNGGWIISNTEPSDSSVLWIDPTDNTIDESFVDADTQSY